MFRRALFASFTLAASVGCDPEIPEGVFLCEDNSECPRGWVCARRDVEPQRSCFPSGSIDAGPPSMSGTGSYYTPDGSIYECGRWERVHFSDPVPAHAVPYGVEYTPNGPQPEYLCRFEEMVEGKKVLVQGRGIFGSFCLAPVPAGQNIGERTANAALFEVFTDPQDCVRTTPYYPTTNLLATGTDVNGDPTFSCIGIIGSVGGIAEPSKYLGRLDLATKQCRFSYYNNVRAAPAVTETNEKIEVLAIPR